MIAAATSHSQNPYEFALQNFDLAADALGLSEDVRAMIKYPERELRYRYGTPRPAYAKACPTSFGGAVT